MFGNRKMYKRGLADAMQAYEGFSKKQQEALEKLRQDVASGNTKLEEALTGLGDELNGIYQYLDSREKAALYRLESSMDLKELDEPEQQLLLAVLYQLADDEGDKLTDSQRAFIRSIQRYVGITNPQTSADLSVVGDIDSLDVQKAFLRTTLEFFYLQDGEEISEQQEDFLSNFSVNRKQTGVIENSVSRLYNIMGAEGLAEKYGFVPEQEPEPEPAQPADAQENWETPDAAEAQGKKKTHTLDRDTVLAEAEKMELLSLDNKLYSNIGKQVSYSNQHIIMDKSVTVDGAAIFRNCVIDLQCGVSFRCRTEDKQKECSMIFDCCVFIAPKSFPGTEAKNSLGFQGQISFTDCTFLETHCSFIDSKIMSSAFTGCPSISICSGSIGGPTLSKCVFSNCKNIKTEGCSVEKCSFSRCEKFTTESLTTTETKVSDCTFTSCETISIDGPTQNCKFSGSNNFTFDKVIQCEFREISSDETPIYLDGQMEALTFDGITLTDDAYLVFPNTVSAHLANCTFKNIRTSRSDKELFEETSTTTVGSIFKRSKTETFCFVDRASCKLLNDIQSL